jgi:glycosyltransferase involved in cell wall biosynthesis
MSKIYIHLLAMNEEKILVYALRHYCLFANKIIVHDLGSTDGTLDVAAHFGVEVRQWDSKGEFNDQLNLDIKNSCWQGTDADWCVCADTDELVFFPQDREATLNAYLAQRIYMVRPTGWEMFSEVYPTTNGQIYDEIKSGARDNTYSKPILFYPKMVKATNFRPGAHSADAEFNDGTRYDNPVNPPNPPCYLLHFHQIQPFEKIAEKYDKATARMCEANHKNNWGWQGEGKVHAKQKRDWILPRLERVVP